jgi:hypothetical protein
MMTSHQRQTPRDRSSKMSGAKITIPRTDRNDRA